MDSKPKDNISNSTSKLDNQSLQWTMNRSKSTVKTLDSRVHVELCKVLTCVLFILAFFLPSQSILYIPVISTIIGSSYYLLCETQPQFMLLVSIFIKYQLGKFKNKFNRWTLSSINDNKIRLKKDDNFIFLEYYDIDGLNNPKKYIYLFNQKLKSNDLIIFKDEFDNDITNSIEPYLGPLQDFHGVIFTPNDFNHKKIKIFRDGDICISKVFEENEPLIMK
jgi:hypothetical protein